MDKNQLLDGLARAVEAAKPAQEYCFLGCQHWSMCMTKAEWSGWMQAVFSVLAIVAAILIANNQRNNEVSKEHKHLIQRKVDEKQREKEILHLCELAALDAVNALDNLKRKISGEIDRPPMSSYLRLEAIERTFNTLLAKQIPVQGIGSVLIILRDISFSKRAAEESNRRYGLGVESKMSIRAGKRTENVSAAASDLNKQVANISIEIDTLLRAG